MGTKVMFQGVRGAFLELAQPKDYQGDKKFRWSAVGLLPYNSPQLKQAQEALQAEAKAKWPGVSKSGEPKWKDLYDNIIADPKACCLADGKRKANEYDGYAGHFALSAHRKLDQGRPLVYSKLKEPIYKPDNSLYDGMAGKVYAGMYVNLQVEFWAQDNNNGKALRCTLIGVQAFKDGDAFGGGAPPNPDDFGEISEGADADALG